MLILGIMKIAFVTGANGFIGSFLVEKLLKEGFEVRCLVRKTSNLRWIKDLPIRLYYGSIAQLETLTEPLKDAEYAFHIAATKYAFTEKECDEVNHLGTLNLLEACKKAGGIKKFVYVSSLAVIGPNPSKKPCAEDAPCNPISHYGSSKLKGEKEVERFNSCFPTVIVRPPLVYGPRDMDLLPIFKAARLGVGPRLGSKERFTSLVYVKDLVDGIFKVSQSDNSSGKIYFICHKAPCSYNDIVDTILLNLNKKGMKIIVPIFLLYLIAFLSEILSRITGKPVALNIQKAKMITQSYWLCSPAKIEKELGIISKTSLDEGIKETVNWYKANKFL